MNDAYSFMPVNSCSAKSNLVGLVALSSDRNIETELHKLSDGQLIITTTRIENEQDITCETLSLLQNRITDAVKKLSVNEDLATLVFGCTSASALMTLGGQQTCSKLDKFIDPASSITSALRYLKAERVLLIAPYKPEVTLKVQQFLNKSGVQVVQTVSLNINSDKEMTAVDPERWCNICFSLAETYAGKFDAIVFSCTSIRASEVVADLEAFFKVPVITSNTALIWKIFQKLNFNQPNTVGEYLSH